MGTLPEGYLWRPQPTMVNSVGMRLVWIPPGSVLMRNGGVRWDRESGNWRFSIARGFWLGAFEVTRREWCAVMPEWDNDDVDPESTRAYGWARWWDASLFCVRLSHLEGRLYRLPSEVEWEYACRAGADLPSSWVPLMAQVNRDWMTPGEVGRLLPNPWGLYDMLGNVNEWCADDWCWSITELPRDGTPFRRVREPSRPLGRRLLTDPRRYPVRGGAFNEFRYLSEWAAAVARWLDPSFCDVVPRMLRGGAEIYGFRVVLDGPPPEGPQRR